MRKQIEDEWEGWDGDTIVRLTDGSVWRQAEYYYEYRYAYRPQAILDGDAMYVDGMRRAVRVRRID
ncbi:hypothetical protein [Phenylobacterium koreense]|uniref:Uncharacterized protein n=1 Tax=Phenylobacterium koreense TaxID=266125 RepID=A0ABV2ELW2_9CAUL